MSAVEQLGAEKYLLLTTFRRDGTPVPTAVWVARDGDHLVAWTVADSGKVKRIRRSPQVTVAPCDLRGRPRGAAVTGHATIADPDATRHVRRLLMRKYGLPGRLTILASRLRRGEKGTVGIRIAVPG